MSRNNDHHRKALPWLSLNPKLLVLGVGGACIGDMVVLRTDGNRLLTKYPREIIAPIIMAMLVATLVDTAARSIKKYPSVRYAHKNAG